MDPIQQLYMSIRTEQNQVRNFQQLSTINTGAVGAAYNTILSVHQSTVSGLNTQIQTLILQSLSTTTGSS